MHKSTNECQIIQTWLPEEAAIVCQKWAVCIDIVRGPVLVQLLKTEETSPSGKYLWLVGWLFWV